MDNNLELISNLIFEHDCSLKVVNGRYIGGVYIILGYEYLIDSLGDLLTGGDTEWDCCETELVENIELLPFVSDCRDINRGLLEIENKIFNNIKDSSLKEYLSNFSKIYNEIISNC